MNSILCFVALKCIEFRLRANLSQIYFTNRQDRYLVIRNEGLADYLHSLLLTVGKHSFTAMDDTSLQLSKFSGHHPCKNPTEFTHAFLEDISSFTSPSTTKVPVKDASKPVIDTIIFPTLQLGNCGLNHDKSITEEIISWNLKQTRLRIASGYMNFPISYLDLFSKSQGSLELYTCSPEANGFHSGKGILKYIPDLYLDIAQRTSNHIDNAAKSKQVFEYYRQGWTFHSKGLWLSPAGIDKPILSSIGSPNFGNSFFSVIFSSRFLIYSLSPNSRPSIHL